MNEEIESIVMPKWGMTMTRGTLVSWKVAEGDEVAVGDEIAEVETEKMLGAVESQVAGSVRRLVAGEGDEVAVAGLLAVIAPSSVGEEEIDAFVVAAAEVAAADGGEEGEDPARTIEVEGSLGRLHAVALGEGPQAVVLLHGFGGDALNWQFAQEALAEAATAIAIDLPGHGSSVKAVGRGDVESLVTATLELLDAEGIERAHFVGHSLGGLVAAAVALEHPDRVASLALLAPAGFGEEIDREFVDAITVGASRRELKGALGKLFADEALLSRQLIEDVLRYKRLEGVPEALAALRDELFPDGHQRVQVADRLSEIEVPLLVVWGAEDRVIPATQAEAAPAAARVEVLAEVGHSPQIEASARLNQLLAEHVGATATEGQG